MARYRLLGPSRHFASHINCLAFGVKADLDLGGSGAVANGYLGTFEQSATCREVRESPMVGMYLKMNLDLAVWARTILE